jgi:F1F0 ATPase subunit 2
MDLDQKAMTILLALLFLGLGAGAGACHFIAIAKGAHLFVSGAMPTWPIALMLGRWALTIAVLWFAAREGAAMLLAAAAGFMGARHMVLQRLRLRA